MKKVISIVSPFYNEESCIHLFYSAINDLAENLPDYDFEFVCVDDGSKDATLKKLCDLANRDTRFVIVELTRNFGKEAALTAGLDIATGDAIVPFDSDLQDPPEIIPDLIEKWEEGFEVVLAVREDRSSDTFMKRKTAAMFYNLHNKLSDIEIPANVGDFRLMDRVVVECLKLLPERQRFMKGIFAWVGYKTATVGYARQKRVAGSSKFSGWKLWNFAVEGITSFSISPLKIWTYIGVITSLFTIIYLIYIVIVTIFLGSDVPGYPSLLVATLFFGSIQLVGIGMLGEYIGRIYIESKERPRYLVRRIEVSKK